MYDSISLFSGAMGLDLGLEKAGITFKLCQDFDLSCYETMLVNNRPGMTGDIRKIKSGTILEKAHLKKGEAFLLCGGPPCQPFSTAGKRLGINDPRGSLFMDYVRMVDETRPRFFVFENVKGLTSISVDEGGAPGGVLEIIITELEKLGYSTVYSLLDAVYYGVPQFRERMIIIGSRDHEDIFLPEPSHFQRHQNPDMRWKTLESTILDLEDQPGPCMHFSEDRLKYLRMVPEGGNWRDLPPEIQPIAMGGAWKSGGGKVGFYRRLAYNQPSPTIVTSPVQKATMMCHPTKDRPLSVKEYARIQQFPEDWIITGTITNKYRQIGNAVPIGLAEAVGKAVIATANGDSTVKTKRTRGTSIHNHFFHSEGGNQYGN
ncbi:MAG: DNA cytosine methyltransferase [Clostridia bacterium]|nr:DNA cytosine methyltransferase [Clostridia bacterium]